MIWLLLRIPPGGSKEGYRTVGTVHVDRRAIWAALTTAIILSLWAYFYVRSGNFGVCRQPDAGQNAADAAKIAADTARWEQAIKALDGVVDVGIKLSTALVGLGAPFLLGVKKSRLTFTTSTRIYILISMMCFVQSALYALWWRSEIANLWFNNCLSFLIGLLFLGVLIANEALKSRINSVDKQQAEALGDNG
jgi:hypothetical protein